jgi:hypothetical protein
VQAPRARELGRIIYRFQKQSVLLLLYVGVLAARASEARRAPSFSSCFQAHTYSVFVQISTSWKCFSVLNYCMPTFRFVMLTPAAAAVYAQVFLQNECLKPRQKSNFFFIVFGGAAVAVAVAAAANINRVLLLLLLCTHRCSCSMSL